MRVHYATGLISVACGQEAGWRSRGYENLDLPRTTDKAAVTCQRCLANWRFNVG